MTNLGGVARSVHSLEPTNNNHRQGLATGIATYSNLIPMAISLESFERQFRDFGDAIKTGRKPVVGGIEGLQALEIVLAVYQSCRTGEKVRLN